MPRGTSCQNCVVAKLGLRKRIFHHTGGPYSLALAIVFLGVSSSWVLWQHGSIAGEAMRRLIEFVPNRVNGLPNIYIHARGSLISHRVHFYYSPGVGGRVFLAPDEEQLYYELREELWSSWHQRIGHHEWRIQSRAWREGFWAPVREHRVIELEEIFRSHGSTSEEEFREVFSAAVRDLLERDQTWNARFGDLTGRYPVRDRRWIVSGILHNFFALAALAYLAGVGLRAVGVWWASRRYGPGKCSGRVPWSAAKRKATRLQLGRSD